MRIATRALLSFLVFSVLTTLAFGQADTGSISGTVRDSLGAILPDAVVTVRNTDTSVERTTRTDNTGQYTFPALARGIYDVSVTKTGFKDYKVRAQVSVGSCSMPSKRVVPAKGKLISSSSRTWKTRISCFRWRSISIPRKNGSRLPGYAPVVGLVNSQDCPAGRDVPCGQDAIRFVFEHGQAVSYLGLTAGTRWRGDGLE